MQALIIFCLPFCKSEYLQFYIVFSDFSRQKRHLENLLLLQVKTADTGYMSRRLIKALEDLSIFYDNTVRNASASIVQFKYGGDAMDPGQMEEKSGLPLNFERLFMKAKVSALILFSFIV